MCGKISEIGNRAEDVKRACRPEKVSGYFVMAAVLIYHQERVLIMIRIQQLKVPLAADGLSPKEQLENRIRRELQLSSDHPLSYEVRKRSIDARKKPRLFYVYTVDVEVQREGRLVKKLHRPDIVLAQEKRYHFPGHGDEPLTALPVVAGAGPAGLFCAYELALHGYRPLIVERGKCVEERTADVIAFWERGILKPDSNVAFGEGGAGTFSDGKLNTVVKDPAGRGRHVLELFCKFGAPPEILYESRPHVGTDILIKVVRNMREEIKRLGGKFFFETKLTDLRISDGRLTGIVVRTAGGDEKVIDTQTAVIAVGHSARDTFARLHGLGLFMEPKAFAVGLRVEHPQKMINESQYGMDWEKLGLPTAAYKVTANPVGFRGVYSFCMCPGGYVVNASSEPGRLAVNGMSNYRRDSGNANSAIIVSVTPSDFPGDDPLSGVRFQQQLEEKAARLCGGKIPQQLFGDFKQRRLSDAYGGFASCTKGQTAFGALHELLTPEMNDSFLAGMKLFGEKLSGFDRYDAILSGVESRTSSPLRILRDERFESNVRGVYPCGEGAGYAGGIMSAAMDGIKTAERLAQKYTLPASRSERAIHLNQEELHFG